MLLGRKGVENAAYCIHLFRDLRRTTAFGALEKQVLDEMRDPVLGRRFMARSVLYPNSEADRAVIRHLLRDDTDAIVEDGLSKHGGSIGVGNHRWDESSEPAPDGPFPVSCRASLRL